MKHYRNKINHGLSEALIFLILRRVTGREYATNNYKLTAERNSHKCNHHLLRNGAHLENIFSYRNNLWLKKFNVSGFSHTTFTYSLKCTSRYFPNRDELSLRTVLALPKLSNRGEASSICSVIRLEGDLFTAAKYCITSFVDSVFPEPLSPEITTT
jgi:hypothetical protein